MEQKGFKKIKIVRLNDTEKGALKLTGRDMNGVEYRLCPASDGSLTVMAWPWSKEKNRTRRIENAIVIMFSLLGPERSNGNLFVGPAVNYSGPAVTIDNRGAALWTKTSSIDNRLLNAYYLTIYVCTKILYLSSSIS